MATNITWLGHSGYMVETEEHTILIDPFLTGNPLAAADPASIAADYILLTHGHGDHVGDTASIAQRTGATVYGNLEVVGWLQGQGVENVVGFNTGGTATGGFGSVALTIAFHSSSMPDGSYGGVANGLFITLKSGKRIYHAGDTALFSDMQLIGERGVDLAILPIGDFFTMGPDDAISAIRYLRPRYVMPCHYNTFPPIVQDPAKWASAVGADTLSNAIVLDPGGRFELV